MSSTAVAGQFPTIDTIFDPPSFSLDTTFKHKNSFSDWLFIVANFGGFVNLLTLFTALKLSYVSLNTYCILFIILRGSYFLALAICLTLVYTKFYRPKMKKSCLVGY